MSCSKSIIECLREKKVEPFAATNNDNNRKYPASNAINYTSTNYYYSTGSPRPAWWTVDFKQKVTIEKYQIKDYESYGNRIYSWTAHVSNDNLTYELIDTSSKGYPSGKYYTLSSPRTLRYFKIFGKNVNDVDVFQM